jgi:hypothetical protein
MRRDRRPAAAPRRNRRGTGTTADDAIRAPRAPCPGPARRVTPVRLP